MMTNVILFLAVLCGGAWLGVGSGLPYWATDWCFAAPALCDNPQPLAWAAVALAGLWIAVRVAMSATD